MPDYLPPVDSGLFDNIARTIMQGAQAQAQGSEALGQGIGGGIEQGVSNFLKARQYQHMLKMKTAPRPLFTPQGQPVMGTNGKPVEVPYNSTILPRENDWIPVTPAIMQTYKDAGYAPPTGPIVNKNEYAGVKQIAVEKLRPLPENNLTPEQHDNLQWGLNHGLIAPQQITYRGPKSKILADDLGAMKSGKLPVKSLISMDVAMAGQRSGAAASARLNQWPNAVKTFNPINAPSGTLLAKAGLNNFKAERAINILNSKHISSQKLALATTDLASVMKTAAPDENLQQSASFNNLSTRFAQFASYLTSDPHWIDNPKNVEAIREAFSEVADVDNAAINNAIESAKTTYAPLIKSDPEGWKAQLKAAREHLISVDENKSPNGTNSGYEEYLK